VSVKDTLPSPQHLTAGPQTTHQQIGQGLGYAPVLALKELPPPFPAPLGFGSPNPGENLARTSC